MSNQTEIIIWGASGHAISVANNLRFYHEYKLIGYIDDVNPMRHGQLFEGNKIIGGSEQLKAIKENGIKDFILGFGHCQRRIEIGHMLKKMNFRLPSFVHPNAIVASDAQIGEGVVILAGSIIDAGCNIGNYTIVNNGAIISHECNIGEGVHVCPGVNIAGRTTVGKGTWLGIGSTIIDKLTIGDFSFIGAGSVVTKNIAAGKLVYGNPAKVVKDIEKSF